MDAKIISSKIKLLRISMNMTQKDFGELINVTQATLSSYENNSQVPNVETLCNIAEKCNVTMDWLCGLSNIKRINNFDRYSDIASLLLNIFKTIDVYIEPPDTMGLDFYSKITIHDDNLNNFIEKWIKLKDIHKDKTIDDEMYEMVVQSLIDKYKDTTIVNPYRDIKF